MENDDDALTLLKSILSAAGKIVERCVTLKAMLVEHEIPAADDDCERFWNDHPAVRDEAKRQVAQLRLGDDHVQSVLQALLDMPPRGGVQ